MKNHNGVSRFTQSLALFSVGVALSLPMAYAAGHESNESDAHQHEHDHKHDHEHQHDEKSHSHAHNDEAAKQVYKGYFEDSQIKDRALSDWAGEWQSVYPYLVSGDLDVVMEHKAEHGDKTAKEYKAYYEKGYQTDVDRIVIADGQVTFGTEEGEASAEYDYDGYEILEYEKGNRGVRFVYAKAEGDEQAPQYIQFSDHRIAPEKSDHFHLYWGDDREALLSELSNWPTYYPASMSKDEVVDAMLAH